MIDLASIGGAGISRDTATDALDIGRARAGLGATELGDQLGMLARRLLDVARVEALQPLHLCGSGSDGDRTGGQQGNQVTHASFHPRFDISPR